MPHVITSHGLHKRFGGVQALNGLDLEVPSGSICAFLGPNGAGKTTAIRILLGLLKADAGTCEVLGRPPGHLESLRRLGALVESPSLYAHLTGWENLEITRILKDLPSRESHRVLSLVGLSDQAHRVVQGYSLGMRQRLGLALALLGEPELLILDEPTNGLDPNGIQEIRALLRQLPALTGTSVFLSSHLLAEVEQTADFLVIVHKGVLRYQGPLDQFREGAGARLNLKVGQIPETQRLLASLGRSSQVVSGDILSVEAAQDQAPHIAAALVKSGIDLFEMIPARSNLEDRFLALMDEHGS